MRRRSTAFRRGSETLVETDSRLFFALLENRNGFWFALLSLQGPIKPGIECPLPSLANGSTLFSCIDVANTVLVPAPMLLCAWSRAFSY
ncbi:hypothetical protein SBA5_1010013 [Candidatus Sulfotelmatomonas gaucii]|uniref:Uncharacterized protein n=1 Tax=Candidatus Sulfuritelmatomonas gaucii TaxID=2043161 RepID=A0A2N9L2P9_9BACT|nr:hypothetical protein SBA5_1010013 [Candidatus Sulfotelmatomonas gaucii]